MTSTACAAMGDVVSRRLAIDVKASCEVLHVVPVTRDQRPALADRLQPIRLKTN